MKSSPGPKKPSGSIQARPDSVSDAVSLIDADSSKEKDSNRSGDSIHRAGDYRYFCPDSADNPVPIARRRLLYAEL